jgi:hypothetical protein
LAVPIVLPAESVTVTLTMTDSQRERTEARSANLQAGSPLESWRIEDQFLDVNTKTAI